MKRLVMDLDGTITMENSELSYVDKEPNRAVIQQMRSYQSSGYTIIIYTARNMSTHENSIGKINATTLPNIIVWLNKHEVPFDEVHVGKPWCGTEGFYVDDRAIRPDEFLSLSKTEIADLIKAKNKRLGEPAS